MNSQPQFSSTGFPFSERYGWAWLSSLLLLAVSLICAPAHAQADGANGQAWRVGMSAPLSGPKAIQGKGLAQGIQAALKAFNAKGGVDGRQVELLLLDDAGVPARTLANTRELLAQGVVALTGYQGAPGIEAVLELLDSAGVPMIGASSSAESLREPPRRWLFNLRAGAADEMAAMVYQLDTMGLTKVALLGQADGLGRGAMEGGQQELARIAVRPAAMELLGNGAGQKELVASMGRICAAKPTAIVLGLEPNWALEAMRAAQAAGCPRQFLVLSETGASLAAAGGKPAELSGLMVAQVLPWPRGNHPLAQEARRELAV